MGFNPCDCSLKIRESTEIPIPKMGAHLGVWVFILTFSHTPELPSWPAPLQALALVASPMLGLWHLAIKFNLTLTIMFNQGLIIMFNH
jgi:hypothetical protein